VLLYRVHGAGHTWPGHRNYYPRFFTGPTSMEFDATRVIWDFFQAHART
jgi:polyhydroxybutyrate depolymerase